MEQQIAALEPQSVAPLESETLAPHETMELHELINFKTIALAKAKLLQGLVFDKDLKALMQKDVEQSVQSLATLRSLYQTVPIHCGEEVAGG